MTDLKKSKNPPVWIIVLHFRGADHTRTCLNSLRSLTYDNYKVLLLDNGSPDQDGPAIAKFFPEAAFLSTGENLGFAGGANAGIKYCQEAGADWIWLLNNDTKVAMDSLDLLIKEAVKSPRAGIVGAMVYNGSGDEFVAAGRGEIDFRRAKTYLRQDLPLPKETLSCSWVSGSNMLMRTSALRDVGTFDERYFLYFEDTDLCWRFVQKGWKCLLVPQARVEHVGGASTEGGLRWWRVYYYTRNRLLFFREYLKGANFIPACLSISAHLLRHLLVLPFRGDKGRKQLKAEYLGLKDYLSSNLGKATCLDWCDKDC